MSRPRWLGRIEEAWVSLKEAARIPFIIDSEETYDRMSDLVDSILDATCNTEGHILYEFIHFLSNLMSTYEYKHHEILSVLGREEKIVNLLSKAVKNPLAISFKCETKHWDGTNFFLIKTQDDLFEVIVVGNVDPGAWGRIE